MMCTSLGRGQKMNKQFAEFIGTFTLVLFGCGAAVIAGADGMTGIGLTGISFAFGLALIGMAYGIGPVSGCHINPAVTLGVVASGRMNFGEAIGYMIAQKKNSNSKGNSSNVNNSMMQRNMNSKPKINNIERK